METIIKKIEEYRKETGDSQFSKGERFAYNRVIGLLHVLALKAEENENSELEEEIATWIPAYIRTGTVSTDKVLPVNLKELADTIKEWGGIIARHFYELGKNSK